METVIPMGLRPQGSRVGASRNSVPSCARLRPLRACPAGLAIDAALGRVHLGVFGGVALSPALAAAGVFAGIFPGALLRLAGRGALVLQRLLHVPRMTPLPLRQLREIRFRLGHRSHSSVYTSPCVPA